MTVDYILLDSAPSPTCYFSLPVSTHYSDETPTASPNSIYCPDTLADPSNPLLAHREPPFTLSMSSPLDASKLLQLQTSAAHRPAAQPLQHSASTSSNSSRGSSVSSPSMLCCCRCRRESGSGMVQFGTNIYYCSHCAKMTGYCAG